MRLRVQIGDADVDVEKKIQEGITELKRIRSRQAEALRRVRPKHASAERRIVALLNRVAGSVGYRLVPVEGTPPAAVPPAAPAPVVAPLVMPSSD